MKMAIIILAAIAVVLVAVSLVVTETISPEELTRTRMDITEQRIREYFAAHGELPAKLSDLPPLVENRDGNVTDGWGRPIQFIKEGSKIILLSLGKDDRTGGTGQDTDIHVSFVIETVSSQSTTQRTLRRPTKTREYVTGLN